MKALLLTLIMCALLFSCTSEYEQRLAQARKLQKRYLVVEETNMLSPKEELAKELEAIENEIDYLARLSGNEYMFFKELKED